MDSIGKKFWRLSWYSDHRHQNVYISERSNTFAVELSITRHAGRTLQGVTKALVDFHGCEFLCACYLSFSSALESCFGPFKLCSVLSKLT